MSLSAQRGRCRTSRLQDFRVQEYRLPSPPSFKCTVLRESLCRQSKYSLRNTKEKGGIVGNLCISLGKNEGYVKDTASMCEVLTDIQLGTIQSYSRMGAMEYNRVNLER